ncbi:MAG: hemerythrin domain-containing protein [Acidobacteriota bacterium]
MVETKIGADTRFDDVLEQHRELRSLIKEMKRFLDRPRPEIGQRGSHTWASTLAGDLLHLHDSVFRHFREEERSGFLEEIETRHPPAIRAIKMLRNEHDRILAELRELLGAAMIYSEGKSPESPRLRRWTLSILDRIAQHEYEETELFQELQYLNLGVGD